MSGWYTTTAANCNTNWYSWAIASSIYIDSQTIVATPASQPPPETEEQKQLRLQREAEYKRQQEELKKEQEVAVKRAEELLKEHIGIKAFGKLHEVGHIELDSCKYKGRKYRVSNNGWARILVLENDKVVDELCIVPTVQCPDGDRVLAKIVMLQVDEEYVLKTANHFHP